jgi:hypothetical protein
MSGYLGVLENLLDQLFSHESRPTRRDLKGLRNSNIDVTLESILRMVDIPDDSKFSFQLRISRLHMTIQEALQKGKLEPPEEGLVCYCCKKESLRRRALYKPRDSIELGLCPTGNTLQHVQQHLLSLHVSTDMTNQASFLGWGVTATIARRLNAKWAQTPAPVTVLHERRWSADFTDLFPSYAPVRHLLNSFEYYDPDISVDMIRYCELRDHGTTGWVLHGPSSLEKYDEPAIKPEPELKYHSIESAENDEQEPPMPLFSPEIRYSQLGINNAGHGARATDEVVTTSFHQLRFTDELMTDMNPRHTDELEEPPAFRGPSIEAGQGMLPRPREMHHFEFGPVTYY